MVVDRDVLMIEGRSKPGELSEIARKLSVHDINIEYAYTATPPSQTRE